MNLCSNRAKNCLDGRDKPDNKQEDDTFHRYVTSREWMHICPLCKETMLKRHPLILCIKFDLKLSLPFKSGSDTTNVNDFGNHIPNLNDSNFCEAVSVTNVKSSKEWVTYHKLPVTNHVHLWFRASNIMDRSVTGGFFLLSTGTFLTTLFYQSNYSWLYFQQRYKRKVTDNYIWDNFISSSI